MVFRWMLDVGFWVLGAGKLFERSGSVRGVPSSTNVGAGTATWWWCSWMQDQRTPVMFRQGGALWNMPHDVNRQELYGVEGRDREGSCHLQGESKSGQIDPGGQLDQMRPLLGIEAATLEDFGVMLDPSVARLAQA